MADPGFEARLLLREARQGVLATAAGGEPQQGLVTPATDANGDILLLLSGLSAHTRALEAEPACAVFVTGAPTGANPQTTPRVSINGRAVKLPPGSPERAAARLRYLAVHPYAAFYADFDDFSLWRIRPEAAMHVAGFGRARRLGAASFCPDAASVAAIEADREDLRAVSNLSIGETVGLDLDGIDLTHGEATIRRSFDAPATDPKSWLDALAGLPPPGIN